jgi:hypothetical protein
MLLIRIDETPNTQNGDTARFLEERLLQ